MKTILIADDDSVVTMTLKRLLETKYSVLVANDGQGGLDLALENRPDLIICDWHMSPADGWLLAKLREDEWGRQAPVAVLSSDSSPDVIGAAFTSKVVHILPKQLLTPEAIAEKIEAILAHPTETTDEK